MKPTTLNRMAVDKGLSLKLAIMTGVGLFIALITPMILDPQLSSQVQYGARNYASWHWALLLSCPLVSVGTYFLIDRRRRVPRNVWLPLLPLGLVGAACSFVFVPTRPTLAEQPHGAVLLFVFVYGLLFFVTVIIRQSREADADYVADNEHAFAGRLERLKAMFSIWQQVTVVGTTAYLVFAIYVVTAIYTSSSSELTSQSERNLHAVWFISQAIFYSVWVIIGPLNEAFEMMLLCAERLSTIPKDAA